MAAEVENRTRKGRGGIVVLLLATFLSVVPPLGASRAAPPDVEVTISENAGRAEPAETRPVSRTDLAVAALSAERGSDEQGWTPRLLLLLGLFVGLAAVTSRLWLAALRSPGE